MKNYRLKLFQSQPLVCGGLHNTSFSVEPTEITEANAEAVFRHGHTPICFKGGHCKGENFEYAMSIIFDEDNSRSDNPVDWVYPDTIAKRLKEFGINFVTVASRNHMLPKEKNGMVQTARPRFHVYPPLSAPLYDSDQYVRLCEWCIKTFNSDPKVKSKAQKIFGYGDNPHAFVESWNEGRCIDEVLSEVSLAAVVAPVVPEQEKKTPVTPSAPSPKRGNSASDPFVNSGEWIAHLDNLEALGWAFFEKDGILFFQTPDGDHAPGKQDGNIKDGVAYFFSKAPTPFVENKGYAIRQFFAGALFGDIGKTGLGKFARQYLSKSASTSKPSVLVPCGVAVLDTILANIELVNWSLLATVMPNGTVKPPSEKDYILRTVEQILHTADKAHTPLVNLADLIHYFTGTHYKHVNNGELRNFLIEGAIRCGVPSDVAIYQFFVDKIVKQFLINAARHNSGTVEPDTPYINLKNGTLFFDGRNRRFEKHSPQRFIRYCLHFEYDPEAKAPLLQKHLDRTFPSPAKQLYVAAGLALPFYPGKIEKAPTYYGERDTGKSTTLDIYKSLVGVENYSTESLAALTKEDTQGAYARARLDGKLVNIASDISAKINDDGMAKMLISREEVSARHPYGKGFDIRNYARLIFAMNTLPPQFFTDAALTKRVALVHFDQQIRSENIDTNFTENIIANELPGVLNWIITGLDHMLKTGRLDPPPCCVEEMERLRKELDPLSAWLDRQNYHRGKTLYIPVDTAYQNYVDHCRMKNYKELSDRTFTKRLRDLGYTVERPNGHIGTVLYYANSVPDLQSPRSPQSPSLEIKDEHGDQAGNEPTPLTFSFPIHPAHVLAWESTNGGSGNEGNVGNENWAKGFDSGDAEFAAVILKKLREPGSPAIFFDTDILPHFNGDRVSALRFLDEHVLELCNIGGKEQVIEGF